MSVVAPSRITWTWHSRGRIILGGLAAALVAALALSRAFQNSDSLFQPWSTILIMVSLPLGWCIAASAMARCGLRNLQIDLITPPRASQAMQPIFLTASVKNRSKHFPALFLEAIIYMEEGNSNRETCGSHIQALDPAQQIRMEWRVLSRSRGVLHLRKFRVNSRIPGALGWATAEFTLDAQIALTPATVALRSMTPNLLVGHRLAAGRMSFVPAAMEEYMGVREYRSGDNPRLLHRVLSLRGASHGGALYVREFEDPTIDDTCLILDTAYPIDRDFESAYSYRLEKALAFTLAFSRMLQARKQRIRVLAPGQITFPESGILIRDESSLDLLGRKMSLMALAENREKIMDKINQETRFGNMAVVFVSLRELGEEQTNRRLPIISITPDMAHRLIEKVIYA